MLEQGKETNKKQFYSENEQEELQITGTKNHKSV